MLAVYEGAGSLPEDVAPVSDETFSIFSGTPPEGMLRGVDDNGNPVWVSIPPLSHEQLVEQAESMKAELLYNAKSTISLWQTELQLGIISDDDKASLIAWMKYIQALNAVDTSAAPDIEWPVKPE